MTIQQPILQPPGAGLPKIELFFAKLFLRIFLRGHRGYKLRAKILSEQRLTVSLINSFPKEKLHTQVLVPKIMGIEDSSRYWSAAMTLQHLVITTNGMVDIAEMLIQGIRPSAPVRIADVKPKVEVSDAVFQSYQAAIERLINFSKTHENLKTTITHAHPWFGELDGHGWIGLATAHLGIHRRQLGFIKALLPK